MRKRALDEIGADEVLLFVALLLVTIGAWAIVGRAALTIPGGVLLWVALPARAPFVTRAEPPPLKRSRI